LKICVLVKEVPDAAVEKRIDASTGRMDRSGEKNLNPFDTHAIEAAMQLKEGGAIDVDEVVAVTMGPSTAERALRKAGHILLDCPISGTPAMVTGKNGVLFVSGDKAVAERCAEAFGVFAPKNFYVGEFGCGMAIKLVTNFLVGANSLAVAEAFLLGIRSGLDPDLMLKVIGPSAGGSRVFDFRGPMIAARKFQPAPGPCHILWKDLQFIQEQSRQLGLAAPVLAAQMEWFGKMVQMGKEDDECAAIFEVLEGASRRS